MGSLPDQYTTGDLLDRILAALTAAGHEIDPLDPEALAPVEDFHTLGRVATVALADAAAITAEDRVLDLGSGIGGPGPFPGPDLRLSGRRHRPHAGVPSGGRRPEPTHRASTTSSPPTSATPRPRRSPTDAFDVVWTQHVAMNIEDKAGLYAEARRVLKPGGRLAFFDIMAGPERPLALPGALGRHPRSQLPGHRPTRSAPSSRPPGSRSTCGWT